jgi:hypothetical protein
VVNITSTAVQYDFFYGRCPSRARATGFILDKQGHILTNNHVIAERPANRGHPVRQAQVQGEADRQRQRLTISRCCRSQGPDLVPATLSDSQRPRRGPEGLRHRQPLRPQRHHDRGIISSIRSVRGPQGARSRMRSRPTRPINPGNSGGPLLNSRGEVIGITSMIASNGADQNSGIGFAIPINTAKAVLEDFAKYGHVRRPRWISSRWPSGRTSPEQMGLAADCRRAHLSAPFPAARPTRPAFAAAGNAPISATPEIYLAGDLIVGHLPRRPAGHQSAGPRGSGPATPIMNRHEVGY